MYETEDRIKENRRKTLIVTIVIVGIFILLLFIILVAGKGTPKEEEKEIKQLQCELQVAGGVQPDNNGVYRSEIEIAFKRTDLDGHIDQVVKKSIGETDNSDTFKIIRSGNYVVYGYLEDKEGNTGTCVISVNVQLSTPTCELEASSNNVGENGWYRDNVEVTFRDMSTNNPNSSVTNYYIEKSGVVIDVSRRENNDKYEINQDGLYELTGYVVDSNGVTGQCEITVKKDTRIPSCRLKVVSGTISNGIYVDTPTIGFDTYDDNNKDTLAKGVGLTKNFTQESYAISQNGIYMVYGYVKDEAGNENICSLQVKRDDGSGISNVGTPSCLLYIAANPFVLEGELSYATYLDRNNQIVKVYMETSANVAAYGIGTEENYNGSQDYIITKPGKYTVTGYVKNAAGDAAYCVTPEFTVKGALLHDVAKVGDFVNYDISYSQKRCDVSDTSSKTGWKVLKVLDNGQVVLVSNGITDCVEHNSNASATISDMQIKAQSYLSSKLALSAEPLSCSSPNAGGCQYSLEGDKLYNIGNNYLMGTSANNEEMWLINSSGMPLKLANGKYGMRTVIVLSPYVVTSGKSNGVWIIDR